MPRGRFTSLLRMGCALEKIADANLPPEFLMHPGKPVTEESTRSKFGMTLAMSVEIAKEMEKAQ